MKAMTQAEVIRVERLNQVVGMMRAHKKYQIANGELTIWWRGWRFRIDKANKVWPTAMRCVATTQEVEAYLAELCKAVGAAQDAETFAEDDVRKGDECWVVMPDKTEVAGKVAEVYCTPKGLRYKVATENGNINATDENIILKYPKF